MTADANGLCPTVACAATWNKLCPIELIEIKAARPILLMNEVGGV
jgi:hypothetical protein